MGRIRLHLQQPRRHHRRASDRRGRHHRQRHPHLHHTLDAGTQGLDGGALPSPVDKGKRIKPGQTIQLAPNGTDTSMSGFLIGVVRSVSQYPVSTQAIQKRLSNDHLSQYILQSQQSAVMEVTFDLVKDDTSESGYLWTSTIGDHKPITAGSFVTGSIIIERRPPIQKVFYKLSQWLRNG